MPEWQSNSTEILHLTLPSQKLDASIQLQGKRYKCRPKFCRQILVKGATNWSMAAEVQPFRAGFLETTDLAL